MQNSAVPGPTLPMEGSARGIRRTLDVHDSSSVERLRFNEGNSTLTVWFRGREAGERYVYRNVGPDVWLSLVSAALVGRTLYDTVRAHPDRYPVEQLGQAHLPRGAGGRFRRQEVDDTGIAGS